MLIEGRAGRTCVSEVSMKSWAIQVERMKPLHLSIGLSAISIRLMDF